MLAIVARSGTDRLATPAPTNSTMAPTTPWERSSWVIVRTRSVALVPGWGRPVSRTPITRGGAIRTGSPSRTEVASMPPTPQPNTPTPPTIGVWESVPRTVSGRASGRPSAPGVVRTTSESFSRLIWWMMPLPGGTTFRSENACSAQRSIE